MLSSLEIKNFKGIKEGTIPNLAQVNVLVGRNNSGKSTVLDALLLMRCAFAAIDFLERDGVDQTIERKVSRAKVSGYPELHFKMAHQERIQLGCTFNSGEELTQDWQARPGAVPELNVTSKGTTKEFFSVPNRTPERRRIDDLENSALWSRLALHPNGIGQENYKLLAKIHLLDPTSLRSPMLEELWEKLTLDERLDLELRDWINTIYQLNIDGFNLMPFGGHPRLVAGLPLGSRAVDWMGDGLRYALNILALGMLLEGTILMVEELETHQHPESLKKLTQTLFELAKRQNLQLFLTTHSWELMTYALEAAEEKDVDLTMHHVRLSEKGEFDSRAIPSPDAKLLADIGHDIRFTDKYIKAQ